ncbi:hypothetical protein LCGC14_1565750 [marine sediment metagenome]|uniref:Phage capsid-like C-terminal domain-containing protein n=1 Tax=marine sediment metagenome TaxID=412755 RepID=A0A0F9LLS5_9ZZZZ
MKTLADYAELDVNTMEKGVMNWLFKFDPLLQRLGFRPVKGNALAYNVKTERAGATWIVPTDDVPEKEFDSDQRTVALKELINDVKVPHFNIDTNSTQDVEALEVVEGIRDLRSGFVETFLFGGTTTTVSTKEPDGILKLIAELETTGTTDLDGIVNTQVIANAIASGALTQAKIEELIDATRPELDEITILMTDRRARRKINALARASGSPLRVTQNEFGQFISIFNEIPLVVSDYMRDNFQDNDGSSVLDIAAYVKNKTRASGFDNSIILALKMGDEQLTGIQSGTLSAKKISEDAPDKDAVHYRMKWYAAQALFNKFAAAVLTGINADT